ncbi:GNAT family N-acetyltransferase [Erythrobacter mangrovi]|uniref:GNAT family N-acetyltransferase n=1 Tax=Erythrobacter mangrovi TaxID=2739433 RepID=A0A7D3XCY3_9SPHN|nr:GNAT family N-acetyltransferase [Erythrobacter mangrovi]
MAAAVPVVRAFNRDFSRLMGLLEPRYMGSELSLVEARVLYEIRTRGPVLARDIADDLRLDPGYLSRIVARLSKAGMVRRDRGKDARERPLSLTEQGERSFRALDLETASKTEAMLAELKPDGAAHLVTLLEGASALLFDKGEVPWSIRNHRVGDMGIIAARQSILYDDGYGWGSKLEAIILDITARFLREFKDGREQCWVAERDGRILGSVFLVEEPGEPDTARLRLLYVEPEARGLGIGQALVRECTRFARKAGYARILLWTHAVLDSARRIYAAEGYRIIASEVQEEFGRPEVSETWLLDLAAVSPAPSVP